MNRSRQRAWWTCVLLAVWCTFAAACRREQPAGGRSGSNASASPDLPRITKARLSGFGAWQSCTSSVAPGHVVPESRCGADNIPADLVSIVAGECNRRMKTRMDAVRLLAWLPQCTDAAVAKLESLGSSRRDAHLSSDLAAAYYTRAERKDQPSDLIRALDAAERAVSLAPAMGEARFNRALAQEALGFTTDAIASWDRLRADASSPWAAEARQHAAILSKEKTRSAAVQWPLNERLLPDAARAGDRTAVAQLVAPYRAAAQRYVEETVLPAWATAASEGRNRDADEQLALAEMIAAALAELNADRYLLDSVAPIRTWGPSKRATFQKACLAYAVARGADPKSSSELRLAQYAQAQQALAAAGSPLRFGALLGRAAILTFAQRHREARAALESVERAARRHRYSYLQARVHAARGYAFTIEGRYLDALAEYAAAEAVFKKAGDEENLSNVYARKVGLFRLAGHQQFTWREMYQARRHAGSVFEPQSRHLLLGEIALSAVELGYPAIALQYQDAAVRLLEDELAHNTVEARVPVMRTNLGFALRARAGIRVRLRDYRRAQTDLNEAIRLMGDKAGPTETAISSGFHARVAEVQGQASAATNRPAAIAQFGVAIAHASGTPYRSLVASLLLQRADLYRRERHRAAALQDLRAAIVALREEQQATLGGRNRPQAEQLWSAFFARPQEAYRQLIRHLVEDGATSEAFDFAEEARAAEPLDLLLQREDLPNEFRKWTEGGQPLRMAGVKQILPDGTYLLQYCVLDDRTYVWTIWNGGFDFQELRAGDDDIEAWTTSLQSFAAQRDVENFARALAPPYVALLGKALAKVSSLHRGSKGLPDVVVVPDRAMHGLPFSALRNGGRFVVQDYTVSVGGSATLYAFSVAQNRKRSGAPVESITLFADPAFNPRLDIARGLPQLRRARSETARIEKLYAPATKVVRRIDGEATVREFLRLARRSAVVHVAVHGIANPDMPSRSFLLLAPAENDSGALEAERLLKELRVENARLAVLSACSSSGGTPVGPEGLAPLVRPVIAAGVPGVLGTLWNVSDSAATEELLVRFHQHYRNGEDAANALRLAQVEMLEDPELELRSVIAWAPFQMIGAASSPFRTTRK